MALAPSGEMGADGTDGTGTSCEGVSTSTGTGAEHASRGVPMTSESGAIDEGCPVLRLSGPRRLVTCVAAPARVVELGAGGGTGENGTVAAVASCEAACAALAKEASARFPVMRLRLVLSPWPGESGTDATFAEPRLSGPRRGPVFEGVGAESEAFPGLALCSWRAATSSASRAST